MWDYYIDLAEFRTMYFLWNFNLSFSDNRTKIGINVDFDNYFNAIYLKNDDDFLDDFDNYCDKYNIDLNIFKPLSQEGIENNCEILLCNDFDIDKDNLLKIINYSDKFAEQAWNKLIEDEDLNRSDLKSIILDNIKKYNKEKA
jgi:hypothetical protein